MKPIFGDASEVGPAIGNFFKGAVDKLHELARSAQLRDVLRALEAGAVHSLRMAADAELTRRGITPGSLPLPPALQNAAATAASAVGDAAESTILDAVHKVTEG